MVARLYPGDAVGGAPAYTGRALRQTQGPFLAGATAARPLGALSGVRPGTPASTVTATSTTWTVQPFAGVIDLQTAAISGPYTFAFDAAVTGTVTAAGGSARIDALSVRVNDGAEGDGTAVAPFADIVYTVGTTSPPAVPARSFVIAYINVPATGGGSPTVTWNAPYTVAAGAAVPFNTLAQLTAWTTANLWQEAVVLTTGARYLWNGSAWLAGQNTTGAVIAVANFTTGTSTSLVKSRDGMVTFNFNVTRTSGTISINELMGTLPTAFCPNVTSDVTGAGMAYPGLNISVMRVYASGAINFVGATGNTQFSGSVTFPAVI